MIALLATMVVFPEVAESVTESPSTSVMMTFESVLVPSSGTLIPVTLANVGGSLIGKILTMRSAVLESTPSDAVNVILIPLPDALSTGTIEICRVPLISVDGEMVILASRILEWSFDTAVTVIGVVLSA